MTAQDASPWWRRRSAWAVVLGLVFACCSMCFGGISATTDLLGGADRGAPPAPRPPASPFPAASPLAPATGGWVVVHPLRKVKIPKPSRNCLATAVDLDTLTVRVTGGFPKDGTDLYYDICSDNNLTRYESNVLLGEGPPAQPEPAECAAQAASLALTAVEAADLVPGESALCVVTDEERVAWMRLSRRGPLDRVDNADLEFRIIVWERGPLGP